MRNPSCMVIVWQMTQHRVKRFDLILTVVSNLGLYWTSSYSRNWLVATTWFTDPESSSAREPLDQSILQWIMKSHDSEQITQMAFSEGPRISQSILIRFLADFISFYIQISSIIIGYRSRIFFCKDHITLLSIPTSIDFRF